ncbi:unnamed protein product [Ectocarpus fasciculatus]
MQPNNSAGILLPLRAQRVLRLVKRERDDNSERQILHRGVASHAFFLFPPSIIGGRPTTSTGNQRYKQFFQHGTNSCSPSTVRGGEMSPPLDQFSIFKARLLHKQVGG